MKKNLLFIVSLFVLMASSGCKKCYYCHNSCKVCQDPHYRILVQSDVLSTQYYNMYIDSLTGLGWSCHDTVPNRDMQVCNENNKIDGEIFIKEQAGWTCNPVE